MCLVEKTTELVLVHWIYVNDDNQQNSPKKNLTQNFSTLIYVLLVKILNQKEFVQDDKIKHHCSY